MTDVKDLVEALADAAPTPPVRLRQGVISAVTGTTVSLTIGGSATVVPGIKYLSSYTPAVGETVWLATDGLDWIVIGKLSDGSGGSSSLPAGSLMAWGATTAPANWLLCDGSVVSQTTYPSLYAAIGATFNTGGEGSGNFRLPDLRGRVPVGSGSGTDVNGTAQSFTLGARTGEYTHKLTQAEMPSHVHNNYLNDPGHSHGQVITANSGGPGIRWDYRQDGSSYTYPQGVNTYTAGTGMWITNISAGGDGYHNTVQPVQVVNWIIKVSNGDTGSDSQLTQRVSNLEALNTVAPRLAASATARNAIFPAPSQGQSVFRYDLGWIETYFATYNASTNPGGAAVAGWYPTAGAMPRLQRYRTSQAASYGAGWNQYNLNPPYMSDSITPAGVTVNGSSVIQVTTPGLYEIRCAGFFDANGASQGIMTVKKNDNTAGATNSYVSSTTTGFAGWLALNVSTIVQLSTSDYISVWIWLNGGATWHPNNNSSLSVNYLGPGR